MIHVATVGLPPAKSAGGIDSAIKGIESALQDKEISFVQDIDKADLVHFHGLWQWDHAQESKKLRKRGVPYIVSPHGMLEPWAFEHKNWKKKPYFHLVEAKHLMRSSAIMVTSELEKRNVSKLVTHSNIAVCPLGCNHYRKPNYAEARQMLNWAEDELIFLYLSRLDSKKGMHFLLSALSQEMPFDKAKARLVVVGDGEKNYLEELRAIEASLKPKLPKIDWMGAVWGHEKWSYLQGADLFCLPTHSENFGIAVLESLHVGTPVLTSDQTPWGEYREQEGFFIIRPEVNSVAQGVRDFFQMGCVEECKRNQLSKWAEDHFSWGVLSDTYADVYEDVLKKSGVR